ncbi:hypothetical protein L486_04161 [Kwoniella mangroviensis CBS 10435]|uniref:Sugar phosphate transporter domain-containing protein n=1 Tax=Kwoniella mangroviensis CBS 10435 TaxID=1331196 RepID=A0A1B9IRG4_9TREE|nr:uncharacterized protein I203_02751 [Kwoniella mangroviensis CBS 8507]OCF58131.1 hypothetical protein L486_04161 [Kwoniella mangroviensis CBS 10435]OCF68091.1 hypothetical protein I203_02751 [Kwoniella mangroviensis CBS 8507]
MSPKTEQHSRLAVLGTVVFYMVVAISMTLLNKSVLSSTPMPVFLLFCQSAVAVVLLGLENMFGPYKTPRFESSTAKDLIPLVFVNVLGLIFNNACLQYVDASFHQVARGLVLPFTIIVTIVVLHQYPSPLALIAALIVTFGFFSGVLFDPNHASSAASAAVAGKHTSSLGITFGAMSSVSSACHAVLIKRGLASVSNSPISLSYYNNILSTLALIPMFIISGELPSAIRLLSNGGASQFLWGATITGLFGFLISLASFISIKVTSPVTHMISSATRGVLQTMLAVWIFGDVMSRGRIISIFLIISGSVLYVYAKTEDSKKSSKQKHDEVEVPLNPKSLERGDVLFENDVEKDDDEKQR